MSDEPEGVGRLLRRRGPLGHPVPVHPHRRRRRRAARVPRLGAGDARRGRAARPRLAGGRPALAARPLALGGGLRDRGDRDPVPADRLRRAARVVVAGGDPDRGRAADHDRAGDPHGPRRARHRPAPRGAVGGPGGRRGPRGHRRRGRTEELVGALAILVAGGGLRGRADAAQAGPERPGRPRDHGREPGDRGRRARRRSPRSPAPADAVRRGAGVDRGAGPVLHRDGVRPLRQR